MTITATRAQQATINAIAALPHTTVTDTAMVGTILLIDTAYMGRYGFGTRVVAVAPDGAATIGDPTTDVGPPPDWA